MAEPLELIREDT